MNLILRQVRRWIGGKTLKREFALFGVLIWLGVVIKLFFMSAPTDAAAQGVNFGTMTSAVWLYVTAAVGIQQLQNNYDRNQGYAVGSSDMPRPADEADYEAGKVT